MSSKSEYLETVQKVEKLQEKVFVRLGRMHKAFKESGVFYERRKANACEIEVTRGKFPKLAEQLSEVVFEVLKSMFDNSARNAEIKNFKMFKDKVTFELVGGYDNANYQLPAIVAYGADQEFDKYLSELKESLDEYVKYLKSLREQREKVEKENAEYEKYLELKAKYEGEKDEQ